MNLKRALLFLIGCIGTRLAIVYIAYRFHSNIYIMNTLGALALLPAIGFFIIYFMGWRKHGLEVDGELIWWNHLRPIHGTLWMCFAISALLHYKNAWYFLFLDVMIGLIAWIYKYANHP